jgi:hypothetical protein
MVMRCEEVLSETEAVNVTAQSMSMIKKGKELMANNYSK